MAGTRPWMHCQGHVAHGTSQLHWDTYIISHEDPICRILLSNAIEEEQTDRTDCFTPCACVQGKYLFYNTIVCAYSATVLLLSSTHHIVGNF